ncbi:MAG TPA: VOC family protein [Micromonosporaceae bacterium]|nr:VOC family protein [Micromonosporaceae bacterium]
MSILTIVGIHHVKFPVTDLERSLRWHEAVFGLQITHEWPDENGKIRGVAGFMPGPAKVQVALRENSGIAKGIAGFDPVSFALLDRPAIEAWAEHLDRLGIEHSPVITASIGYLLIFHDPDGTAIHLYTLEPHNIDQSGRPERGRPVGSTAQ